MLKRLGPFYESHRATLTVVVVAHFAPPRRSVGPSSRIAGSFLLIWALTACAHASPRSTRFGSAYSSAASITAYEVPTRQAHRSDAFGDEQAMFTPPAHGGHRQAGADEDATDEGQAAVVVRHRAQIAR